MCIHKNNPKLLELCFFLCHLIRVLLLKQILLVALKGNLADDCNSRKDTSMHPHFMTKLCVQNSPIFEAFVDCFLAAPNPQHHFLPLLQYCHTPWAPNFQRCLTNVSIVCLHTFKPIQESHESMRKISTSFHCPGFQGPLIQQIHPVLIDSATSQRSPECLNL